MKRVILTAFALVVLCINAASAEPIRHKDGRPTSKIFIMGTKHLHDMHKMHNISVLDNVLDKLSALNPDMISIEVLPPYEISAMQAQPEVYNKILYKYANLQLTSGKLAQQALNITWSEAYALIANPNVDCPAEYQQEKCILLYVAAYDYYSAYLKWASSEKPIQYYFKRFHEHLYNSFQKKKRSSNEYITIAANLALRLGHNRLYPVDDHSDKGRRKPYIFSLNNIDDSLQELWKDSDKHPFFIAMNENFNAAANQGDLLPYYRWVNEPETGMRDEDFQWHQLLINDNKNKIGASFVAMWETRNLRMASHLTRIMAENPGKTMLYIVGAGHKPILDRYFMGMNWVEVLDSKDVLGAKEP